MRRRKYSSRRCFAGTEMAEFPSIVIRSFGDLADAFRAIQNHLQISNSTLEDCAGMCPGFVDKVLGRTRTKRLSEVSFNLLIGALGIELVVRPDLAAAAKMATRWTRRDQRQCRTTQPLSAELLQRAAAELGRRGAAAVAKTRRRAQRREANGHARP